jgi:hypothetical protein
MRVYDLKTGRRGKFFGGSFYGRRRKSRGTWQKTPPFAKIYPNGM